MTLRVKIENYADNPTRDIVVKRQSQPDVVLHPGQSQDFWVWSADNGRLTIEEPAEQPAPETKRGI